MFLFHTHLIYWKLLEFLWRIYWSFDEGAIPCGCFGEVRRSQLWSLIEDSRQDKEKEFQDILEQLVPFLTGHLLCASPLLRKFIVEGWRGGRCGQCLEVSVTYRINEGMEVESKTKMNPGKNSFFQILHRCYQVGSSQDRDWYVLKQRGAKRHLDVFTGRGVASK